MTRLRGILLGVWDLFVDDGFLAASTLVWLLIGWLLAHVAVPPVLSCLVFAVGPPALLIASTLRRAGKGE